MPTREDWIYRVNRLRWCVAKKAPGYYDPKHYTLVHNRYLADLQSRERRTARPDDAHCVWTLDEHDGSYDTTCGNKFQFNTDGPEENGMVYCGYCGRVLGAVGQPQSEDAVDPVGEKVTG